jgi:predicted transposase YdaD
MILGISGQSFIIWLIMAEMLTVKGSIKYFRRRSIEFQTRGHVAIPYRMTDYRLRGHKRYPNKTMHQFVVYLYENESPLVYQNTFEISGLRHEFQVIRLWEQPVAAFLNTPGLLPFAALAQVENPESILQEVAQRIDNIADQSQKGDIAAAAAVLAGLVLDRSIIRRILRRDIMRESTIYQEILEEGEQVGVIKGERRIIIRQLKSRFGELPTAIESQLSELSGDRLEILSEVLLNFSTLQDLETWLQLMKNP